MQRQQGADIHCPLMADKNSIVQDEEKDLPFYMSYVPEFYRKKCERELNETLERKERCIQELRTALKSDKTGKDIYFHEDFLVQFLRHHKYNANKTLKRLQNFMTFRRKEKSLFESIPEEYFSTKSSTKLVAILPKRCPDGCTVIVTQPGKWNPTELEFEDFKRLTLIAFTQSLRDPMTQINGFKIIYDFAGTRFEHIKYCTPHNLYLFYHVTLNCVPARYKEIHLLNETPVSRLAWSIIKRFVSEKMRSRVFFHSDSKELLNYFPKSVLPEQYGGDLVDIHETDFFKGAHKEQKTNTIGGQPNFY